jgi:uncharacterized membrane protein
MNLLAGFRSMISDGIDGSVSSKRVVTLIALSLVVLAFILNLFWGFTVEEHMYNSMMVIVLGGLGTTVAEKFSKK